MLKELLTTFVISASASGVDVTPQSTMQYLDKQATCLAKNMYYEARSQGLAGQLAVSLVVLNRVKDTRFPNTICEVIEQGPIRESWKTRGKVVPDHERKYFPIRNRCQFSWYCDGKHDKPYPGPTWKKTQELAAYYMEHKHLFKDITDGATHYHADYIKNPRWSNFLEKTVKIDTHIFYSCLLYTSPSPRDRIASRMPSSA